MPIEARSSKDLNSPFAQAGVRPKQGSKPCILCQKPVSLEPGQYYWCLFPRKGPAHIECAAKRE